MKDYPEGIEFRGFREDVPMGYMLDIPSKYDFVPGHTVPLCCIGVRGGEKECREIAETIVNIASKRSESSPIEVAMAISAAVMLAPLSEYQYRVHLQAQQVANSYGDWCGGYIDPFSVMESCFRF